MEKGSIFEANENLLSYKEKFNLNKQEIINNIDSKIISQTTSNNNELNIQKIENNNKLNYIYDNESTNDKYS